jgi:peptide/nickel transport system substrate-binding protein
MTREAYNLPLFQKPVLLAVYSDFTNIRNNATSAGPTYNMEEWGLRA